MMTLLAQPTTTTATTLSVDEFLAWPGAEDYELIAGVPTEKKPMGAMSSYVAARIILFLGTYCQDTDAGYVFDSDTMYRCFGNPKTARKGDVSFVAKGRLPNDEVPEGAIEIPADVIVEVVSPTDLAYDVDAKAALYLGNGFGELWAVFPNTRTVHVRRLGQPTLVLGIDDTLSGRGPLAGFACPVRELFPK